MKPEPVDTTVCSVCGEPWELHAKRATVEVYDDDGRYFGPSTRDVELEDCVAVLRDRFRGPMGPAGPQGAMGPRPRRNGLKSRRLGGDFALSLP